MTQKEIEEKAHAAWLEYEKTLEKSVYMYRLSVAQREVDFKAGYRAALKK